jgi:hypothetical protein
VGKVTFGMSADHDGYGELLSPQTWGRQELYGYVLRRRPLPGPSRV